MCVTIKCWCADTVFFNASIVNKFTERMWAHLSGTLSEEVMLADDTSGEIYPPRQQRRALPTISQLSPITVFALPCVPIMIPALLIDAWQEHYYQRRSFLKHQHFPHGGQRYLNAPAELPSINVAVCARVWTVSPPLVPLSVFTAPAWPLTELIFPFTLCEGHLQREGGESQEGTNQREGKTERRVKQRVSLKKRGC